MNQWLTNVRHIFTPTQKGRATMSSVIDTIRSESPEQREQFIVDAFGAAFGDLLRAQPDAMRGKFRKMAASAFTFYRGSACLYYADMARDSDPFLDDKTSRIWIQGDLHAANFGTYLNGAGVFVFDVNDFDEAYVGPFTWDLKRLLASLALIGYQKVLSDDQLREMMTACTHSYVAQVEEFAKKPETRTFALTAQNTTGKLNEILQQTRLSTRVGLLDKLTTIVDYDRRITLNKQVKAIDAATRAKVEKAFAQYLETIPTGKRKAESNYRIKDVTVTYGIGIGSAGVRTFTILVEGPSQALENDILLSMKNARTAAPSRVVTDKNIHDYFLHNGHRTVVSQRALQAYANPWLGYTTFENQGQLVAEIAPYEGELDWDDINGMDELLEVTLYLGQATAKIHCIGDQDSDQTLVDFSTDQAIANAWDGREEQFVKAMVDFGGAYGAVMRDDYRLFIDAFRNGKFGGL
jgi:uncharacterized protein (DUF2252 family)